MPLRRDQSALEFTYRHDGVLTVSHPEDFYQIRVPAVSRTGLPPEMLLVSASEFDCTHCGYYLIACAKASEGESCLDVYRIDRDSVNPPYVATPKQVVTAWFAPPFVLFLEQDKNEIYRIDTRTGESRRLQFSNLHTGYFPVVAADSVTLSSDKREVNLVMKQGCYSGQQDVCRDELKTSHVMSVDVATWEPREVAKPSPGLLTLPFAVGETWYVCRSYNGPAVHQERASLDLSIDPRSPGRTGCTLDTASFSRDKVVLSPASGLVLAHFNGEPKDMLCLWLDEKRDVNGDGTPDELFLKIGHLQGMPPVKSRVERGTNRLGTLTAPSTGNGGYSHIHIELVTGDLSTGCTKAAIRVPFSGEVAFQGAPDLPYDGSKNQWQGIPLSR